MFTTAGCQGKPIWEGAGRQLKKPSSQVHLLRCLRAASELQGSWGSCSGGECVEGEYEHAIWLSPFVPSQLAFTVQLVTVGEAYLNTSLLSLPFPTASTSIGEFFSPTAVWWSWPEAGSKLGQHLNASRVHFSFHEHDSGLRKSKIHGDSWFGRHHKSQFFFPPVSCPFLLMNNSKGWN